MTSSETAIEPSASATFSGRVATDAERAIEEEYSSTASLGPTNDPRRPALYQNPEPTPSKGESVHDLLSETFYDLDGRLIKKLPVDRKKLFRWVTRDLEDRRDLGQLRYGTLLQVDNGRDSLIDAYQEMIDGAVYVYIALAQDPSDRTLRGLFESQLVLLLTARRALAVRNGELEPDGDPATPAETN